MIAQPGRAARSRSAVARWRFQGTRNAGVPPTTVPRRSHSSVLVRDDPQLDDRLNPDTATDLLGRLGSRDIAALTALHQYRYLDREQLRLLLHSQSPRPCQRQLHKLRDLGLAHMWHLKPRVGARTEEPTVWLISKRGARLLAAHLDQAPVPYVRRAADAWTNCWHVTHDLEANGFLVRLAAAAAPLAIEGLYHWTGEESCRSIYRTRGAAIAPDGWGRYLIPGGEVLLLLEWDRGTESPSRLRAKFSTYANHFEDKTDARLSNVLVVAPTPSREETIRELLALLIRGRDRCCGFWLTNLDLLSRSGPLGEIWLPVAGGRRHCLRELPARPASLRQVEDSIAKPRWWERRPGGGEGA